MVGIFCIWELEGGGQKKWEMAIFARVDGQGERNY